MLTELSGDETGGGASGRGSERRSGGVETIEGYGIVMKDPARVLFSQSFLYQDEVVILIGARRSGGGEVGAEHERCRIGGMEILQRAPHREVNPAEPGGLDPHPLFGQLQQGPKPHGLKSQMIDTHRRERHQGGVQFRQIP